jgi:acyl-coenzyme A synthetase/AMP-(fatty) acid ligase
MRGPGRPEPTTFEHVQAIALREPLRVAFAEQGRNWTYQALYFDLVRVIHVLHDLGIRKGDRIGVGMSQFQPGLLMLFAAEHLGAVTLSFQHELDLDEELLFPLVDVVLSDVAQRLPAGVRFIGVDESFTRRMSQVGVDGDASVPGSPCSGDELQRIARTSGSSGRSKFMLMSRHAQETWISGVARSAGLTAESRVLVAGPLVINSHFARATACLRLGAALVDLTAVAQGDALTHVFALPALLERVIDTLGPAHVPRSPAKVCTLGGAVPPSLRERAVRAFGGPVLARYGANEVGEICGDVDANGKGVLTPGVDIRIVDTQGNDLPPGGAGVIAVRTPGILEGYIGNEAATKAAFRDGWFHTGDWGALVAPRVIRLLGRHDDLVNTGGIKVPAAEVEERVRRLVSPQECAVLATNLDEGRTLMGIALVMDNAVSRDDVRRKIADGLHLNVTLGVRILFVDRLPVMGTGKVDRVALLRLFEAPPPGSI